MPVAQRLQLRREGLQQSCRRRRRKGAPERLGGSQPPSAASGEGRSSQSARGGRAWSPGPPPPTQGARHGQPREALPSSAARPAVVVSAVHELERPPVEHSLRATCVMPACCVTGKYDVVPLQQPSPPPLPPTLLRKKRVSSPARNRCSRSSQTLWSGARPAGCPCREHGADLLPLRGGASQGWAAPHDELAASLAW